MTPAARTLLRLVLGAAAWLAASGSLQGQFANNNQPRLEIATYFDRNKDGRLDPAERKAARRYVSVQPGSRSRNRSLVLDSRGPRLTPAEVKNFGAEVPLFDIRALRTIFLEFEGDDWESELVDFFNTDVRLPARMTVDGRVYPDVGVSFRGHTSYNAIPNGGKRSLDIDLDEVDPNQRLLGFRALNLLNANADPTYLRTFLYHHVARQYIPAPRANFVRVVINGESWGIYVNTEQVNSDMTRDQFGSSKGARWKIPGNPRGSGGLDYNGVFERDYRPYYEIKSKDDPKSWAALMDLSRILSTTPPHKLEQALAPILDVDGVLKFLAVDKVLLNNDGYWTRASDYYLYRDVDGRFHAIPWDVNETWREMGRGDRSVAVDPLQGAGDPRKALLHYLVAAPALRERYLRHVRDVAETWLDWKTLGPLIEETQAMLLPDMRTDPRRQFSIESFLRGATAETYNPGGGGPAPRLTLKTFAAERREYLLKHPLLSDLPPSSVPIRKD